MMSIRFRVVALLMLIGLVGLAAQSSGPIRSMTEVEVGALFSSIPPGAFARFNGSPFYVTKVPDLIGIGHRKYTEHIVSVARRT